MMVNYESRKVAVDNNVECINALKNHYDYFTYNNDNTNIFRRWVTYLKVYNIYPKIYDDYFYKIIKDPYNVVSYNSKDIIDLFNLSIDMACKQNCEFTADSIEFKEIEKKVNDDFMF